MAGDVMGVPADASASERTIEIAMSDKLRFDPSTLEVKVGEIITFVVTNNGEKEHEFVLGGSAYQRSYEMGMSGSGHMDHMMGKDNTLTIGPGETGELTWRFTDAGKVLYGCHEPGHYGAGMVGAIAVSRR
jgi:uncharacterized cupredoxin-like copper-binding protein